MSILGKYCNLTIGMAIMAILTGSSMPNGDRDIQTVRVCDGGGITLSTSGDSATDFLWFRNGTPLRDENKSTIDIFESGIYEVMTVNQRNCSSEMSDGIEVNILPPPSFKILQSATLCEGGAIDLTKAIESYDPTVYDYKVMLPTGELENAEQLRQVAVDGIYQIYATYKDLNCPSEVQTLEINIPVEATHASFEYILADKDDKGLLLIKEPLRFINHSIGEDLEYEWDFSDGMISREKNPTHAFSEKGVYTVSLTVKSNAGCISTMEMQLEVNDVYLIMIPNAFTPTANDNRTFSPKFRGISSYNMYIYNTWGDLVYHMNRMDDHGWDGIVNGRMVPNGNYVYKGEFITIDGKKVKRSGVFTLIK